MPSPISINIRCPKHLVQFIESIYGKQPISFPRKDHFNSVLNFLLQKEPENFTNFHAGRINLKILLPYFEDKNVLYNYILTPCGETIFIKSINETYKMVFRDFMNKLNMIGVSKIDSIYFFLETYTISEDNIDMLLRDYQRYRNTKRQSKHYKLKIKSSFKMPLCLTTNIT